MIIHDILYMYVASKDIVVIWSIYHQIVMIYLVLIIACIRIRDVARVLVDR